MKLEVTKRDLEAALKVASIGAAGTGSDITTHFVFRHTEDGRTEVLANNGRLGVSTPLICQASLSSDENAFTVEAKRLSSWLAAVDNAVLTLEFQDRKVVAKSPRGSISLNSLDPELFPYWDEGFNATEDGYSVESKTLISALNHVRPFIYSRDTKEPRLAVAEVKTQTSEDEDRWLQATDRKALGMVRCKALQKASFRLHEKDVGNVISFLSTIKDESVECRESKTRTFFVRGDGAVMNVARPRDAFPDMSVNTDSDPYSWTLKTDDLRSSILALLAGAPSENPLMTFSRTQGQVEVSMVSASGSRNKYHLELLDEVSDEDTPFPEDGFKVSHAHVLKILSAHKQETITIGLMVKVDANTGKVRHGACRFHDNRDGDDYLVILPWD